MVRNTITRPLRVVGEQEPVSPVSALSSQESLRAAFTADSVHPRGYQTASSENSIKDGNWIVAETEKSYRSGRKRRKQRQSEGAQPSPQFCYKPTALRLWFLALMVAILVTFLGLVEYSLHKLPNYTQTDDITKLFNRSLERREDEVLGRYRAAARQDSGSDSVALSPPTPPPPPPPIPSSKAFLTPPGSSATITAGGGTDGPVDGAATGTVEDSGSYLHIGGGGAATSSTSPVAPVVSATTTPATPAADQNPSSIRPELSLASSNYLHITQSTATVDPPGTRPPTPIETPTPATRPPGSTSLCFSDCPITTPMVVTGGGGYLSVGPHTSTVTDPPTEPTSLPANGGTSLAPPSPPPSSGGTPPPPPLTSQITTIQHTVNIPPQATVVQVTKVDEWDHTVTTAVPTTLPATVSTEQAVITVKPGQQLQTATAVYTSVIGGTVVQETSTFTGTDGHTSTTVLAVTTGGMTATLTTTFETAVPTSSATASTSALTEPASPAGVANGENGPNTIVVGITYDEYIMGAFLPTLLAVLIVLPLKLINVNARLFQPFHALASTPGGATPEASIFLRFYGWPGLLAFPRAFILGQPVVIASELLTFGAALLTPVAAEAIAVHIDGGCTGDCIGTLGVDVIPARALQALLGAMAIVILIMMILLSSYSTGVRQNPWSIAGMAALGLDGRVRRLIQSIPRGLSRKVPDREVKVVLAGHRFGLDEGSAIGFGKGYGLVIKSQDDARASLLLATRDQRTVVSAFDDDERRGKARIISFFMLTAWGRALLIFLFSSVMIILVYYENSDGIMADGRTSGFESFMDSQSFGVRFFFTALGVALGFCMATFFRCVAVLSPYLQLSRHPMPASRSILLSPATNPFYGLYSAWRQRHFYLGLLAFTAILADFLPVTLAHVPFSLIETFETQLYCAWLSIAVLALMNLVVAGSFLIKWPHMPVDPRTIAGALFYVSDSWMLGSLEGLSAAGKTDRDHIIKGTGVRYSFGYKHGMSGREMVAVDVIADDMEASQVVTMNDERHSGPHGVSLY